MIRLAVLALITAGPTFAAAEVLTGTPAADTLIATALEEHRVLLTCSSLDPAMHALLVNNWLDDAAKAIMILAEHNVPTTAIAAFREAGNINALMPAPDTPYAEVKALCDAHPDWQTRYAQMNVVFLQLSLPEALAP